MKTILLGLVVMFSGMVSPATYAVERSHHVYICSQKRDGGAPECVCQNCEQSPPSSGEILAMTAMANSDGSIPSRVSVSPRAELGTGEPTEVCANTHGGSACCKLFGSNKDSVFVVICGA